VRKHNKGNQLHIAQESREGGEKTNEFAYSILHLNLFHGRKKDKNIKALFKRISAIDVRLTSRFAIDTDKD